MLRCTSLWLQKDNKMDKPTEDMQVYIANLNSIEDQEDLDVGLKISRLKKLLGLQLFAQWERDSLPRVIGNNECEEIE